MEKKTVPASAEAQSAFDTGIESIQVSNKSIANISKGDKKGGRLLKSIEPLVDDAIEHASKFEDHFPRKFTIQELEDDQALISANSSKITALEIEVRRLKDANVMAGIRTRKNYRIVFVAAVKSVNDDNSLATIVEKMSAPYKKAALTDEQKAEKATKELEKATMKAEKAAKKVADKATKKAQN
jgi:hypothetical protein